MYMLTLKRKHCWLIFILSGIFFSQNVSSGQAEWVFVLEQVCQQGKTITIPSDKQYTDYILPYNSSGVTEDYPDIRYSYRYDLKSRCFTLKKKTNECIVVDVDVLSSGKSMGPGARRDDVPDWCQY